MINGRSVRGAMTARGLTPLLDTLFILLFALLTLSDTRTTTQDEQVRIQLPEVEPAASDATGAKMWIVLEIDEDSSVLLVETGQVLATPADLDRVLAGILEDMVPEEVGVEIRGHRDARHGVAVQLLQHLRLRGFADVSLIALGVDGTDRPWGGER